MSSVIGKVKWFNEKKGFGFIEQNDVDYFAHYSHIVGPGFKNLTEGQEVKFIPVKGPKGFQATDISVVGDRPRNVP